MCLHSWFRELKPFPHTLHITLLLRAQSPPSRDARRCRSQLPADEEPQAWHGWVIRFPIYYM